MLVKKSCTVKSSTTTTATTKTTKECIFKDWGIFIFGRGREGAFEEDRNRYSGNFQTCRNRIRTTENINWRKK